MPLINIQPVILAGGAGTRLWPLSREFFPKPLLPLNSDHSLLQETALRLDGLSDAAPIVVCNEEHRFLVAEQLRGLNLPDPRLLLEPAGRNTAPALTLAALSAAPDDLLMVMPADHVIREPEAFRAAVRRGAALAGEGWLVTFGVVPDAPHTGYGYIRQGQPLGGAEEAGSGAAVHAIAAFVEKPDAETARGYLDSGGYAWNSGMFLLRAGRWLEELERFRPDILEACRAAHTAGCADHDFFRPEPEVFRACPADSIDYAVMERTERGAVVSLASGWCDVGSWEALWSLMPRDGAGNAVQGDVLAHDSKNSLLLSNHRLLAAVGVEDLVAVETADAVLIAPRDRAQEVKTLVEALRASGREEPRNHRCVHRPWGSYESIDAGDRFQVKRLKVNPGAALSLQLHHHRAEHWVVVRGTARVTRNGETYLVGENESTFIPLGVSHRLENPGKVPLELIEVQSGSYLGEDDIIRFEDIYNRTEPGP